MRIRAEFTCQILPPHGIPLASDRGTFFDLESEMIEVKVEGEKVRVTAHRDDCSYQEPVSDETGDYLGERTKPQYCLHTLKAELTLDVEWPGPKHFDREPFERRAVAALALVLRRIRAVTGIPTIDVHVASMDNEYFDENGEPIRLSPRGDLGAVGWLDRSSWQDVVRLVGRGRDTDLNLELFMEAQKFLRARNYNLTVVSAAVACEIAVNQLLFAALHALGGISNKAAENLAREISKNELASLLGCFYDLSPETITCVQDTFNMRNSILHGKRRKQVSASSARAAIRAAQELGKARRKGVSTPGPCTSSDRLHQVVDQLSGHQVAAAEGLLESLTAMRGSGGLSPEDRAWLDADLSHLGEFEPYEWGMGGPPEGRPVRYVPGVGLVVE